MIPAAKLERMLDRFRAVEAELATGQAGNAYAKLSREHAELAPVITTIESYRTIESQLADTNALIADPASELEMRTLAEEERKTLRDRLTKVERELKLQLIPRDAADSSSAII